ncbi:hypothetical protein CPter291_2726 [Collimonas pratensis]|uniref:Uncharacterized protein n=1 Tax=Collimonas pratensis TaxID=279113 RepID=A0ABM5Z7G2_9BURK|nr:hypothetical protein CPter291_2726 [Collimonas pratensis]
MPIEYHPGGMNQCSRSGGAAKALKDNMKENFVVYLRI